MPWWPTGRSPRSAREASSGSGRQRRHAGHAVPDRLDLQELHGAGRHAAGRGRRDRAGGRESRSISTASRAGPPAASRSGSCSAIPAATPHCKETRPHHRQRPARRTSWRAASTSLQRSLRPTHLASEWEYSNTNYQILGRVVEVVSGQDYQAYVAENILEPIGMKHSFVADGEVHRLHGDRAQTMVRHQASRFPRTGRSVARPRKGGSSRAPAIWRATCR